ncbi:MAG: EAL domain-containing protein [Gallionella sp.]|nr:EAL domain-containing protein [Gallionella sp.]MDP1939221.1 EAL domain-containing protein [Gallionella sp.]
MKISTRLLLLFLLVAVLPLALFSYLNLQQDEATLRIEVLGRMSGLADKKAIQVRTYLAERKREVQIRARGSQVMNAIKTLPQGYAAGWRKPSYVREAARLHEYFGRYVEEYGLFHDVFLMTPQGEVIYSQKREADFATNLLSGPYSETSLAQAFREVLMTLEPVISGYGHYAPSQTSALFIAAPVMVDGKLKGVFAAQLGNDLFYRVATDATGLGLSGEAIFAQRDGDDVVFTTPLRYRSEAPMRLRMNPQQSSSLPMLGALFGESGAGMKPDYRGKPVVAAWRYLPELGWGMVVKMDADEVFASIAQQRALMIEVVLGLMLFSGMLAYYFGRQISAPLEAMARTADEVARGSMDRRVDESAPGELGRFALAFNRMAENLQGLYGTLEQRIEQRTRDLQVTIAQLHEEIIGREQVEADLRDNRDRLNEAQRLGQLGSWELNLLSGDLHWSDEIYRMFELDHGQFAPSYGNFLGVIHPDDRDKVSRAYAQSLVDRQEYDVEHRLLMADGRIKWVRERCSSEFDESGKPLRSMGAVQDITGQKLIEDRQRVAAVAFETHEGIMITDANANIIRVNHAFQKITGYAADDVLGKNPRILSSGVHDKVFYAAMWQQLIDEGSWSGEILDKRKSGEIYPKWLTISAVKDEVGKVSEYVAIFSDISARKKAEEEIRNLAFYDTLTRLPNRRLLLERMSLALTASMRNQHYGAVMFLDMDRFKTLNDTMGHDYGDLLLIEVAQRIRSCVREVDTVARMGGDEFVILVEGIDSIAEEASQRAAQIAEKIRSSLTTAYQLKDRLYHSSPSIGVCLYRGNEESVDALLKHADMAMYQAKESGRNTVRFFDPQMQHAVETRAALEADLRYAVFNGQLRLHYQIQVDDEHRALGAEVLVRWVHPTRGMVSPAQFIPVAEESSLILEVGHWVLETACRQLAAWSKSELTRHLNIAVNVSAQQFKLVDFVDRVMAVLRTFDVDASRLKLELTEGVVLNDVTDVVAKMYALKSLGVRLSMDDFGTGYSSLAYLKQLPLDQLKIDQSFVRDITTDPNDAVMVKTIIGMAHNFRLDVIAEGVETEGQLAFLKQHGCRAFQGYLFSKPVPIDEFEKLLLAGGDA